MRSSSQPCTRLLLALLIILGGCAGLPKGSKNSTNLLELRTYHCSTPDGQLATLQFVRDAYQPALHRQGIGPVGVFTPVESGVLDVYVLCPYSNPGQLLERNIRLAEDVEFLASAKGFAPSGAPLPYTRIESRILRAFEGLPGIIPPSSQSLERLLELRIYESRNEELARRKVEMFNTGEIQLMQEVELGPVFFGESFGAADMPNLVYMLSADNEEEHKEHWQRFLKHPDWARMRDLPRYADTVSKITSTLLRPAAGSDI
ncbi:MAG: NIPSNAP family protein [Planctomycetota bacterium]|nr:NIPSNAP family protein [Planctomycetota bacterium]